MCKKHTKSPKTQASHYAFTVVEILIVVVIMAIAAMIAVPMISSAETFQIRSAANIIAADLEYAKSMAISRGQYYSVVFDTANESYEIQDHDGIVIPHPIKKGESLYEVDFENDSRLSRVEIVSTNFNGDTVAFDYLGSPDNGGDVTLQAGTITRTVSVEPVTGYISISE
jgi:prepilin-type N-terminal cleavage/methylation domain-containing protein